MGSDNTVLHIAEYQKRIFEWVLLLSWTVLFSNSNLERSSNYHSRNVCLVALRLHSLDETQIVNNLLQQNDIYGKIFVEFVSVFCLAYAYM